MKLRVRAVAASGLGPVGPWLSLLCLGLLAAPLANADTWTNQAGHVVNARLVAIKGEHVVLEQASGRTIRLRLSSLKPADQQRAREQTGTEALPSELQACLHQAQEDIRRAAQFLQGGKITREEYVDRCEKIKLRFEHLGFLVLKERGEEANTALLARLMQRLDQAIGGK